MSGETPLFCKTFIAGADLTGKRYYAVKIDTDGEIVLAGDGESAVGILMTEGTAGQAVRVMLSGIAYAILGAAVVNAGTNLAVDAQGKLVTAGAGDAVIAYTLEAGGAQGDVVPVALTTRASAGTTGIPYSFVKLSIPVSLSALDNAAVLTDYTPGFAGKIVSLEFIVTTKVTTADKTASLSCKVGNTDTTGGVLSLTSAGCATEGTVVASTGITAGDEFDENDKISIVAADTAAAFTEGSGVLVLTLQEY